MKPLLFIVALALGACSGNLQTRSTVSLAIACDTYATALDQLTPHRAAGKLSASLVSRVDAANRVVSPACAKGSIINPAEAIDTVERGIALLKAVREAL
jgi:hypothetical protein